MIGDQDVEVGCLLVHIDGLGGGMLVAMLLGDVRVLYFNEFDRALDSGKVTPFCLGMNAPIPRMCIWIGVSISTGPIAASQCSWDSPAAPSSSVASNSCISPGVITLAMMPRLI